MKIKNKQSRTHILRKGGILCTSDKILKVGISNIIIVLYSGQRGEIVLKIKLCFNKA